MSEQTENENLECQHEDLSSLKSLVDTNFMEYASYVIKDRAIPDIADGLKPVQRRILHSMRQIHDGKFHKVANVIGHTMQYHPHGDASIGSALVNLANKEYFIDKQGNFGNILTGDMASAARYIECRLTPMAVEVLFNKEITEYIDSYDGRNQEPVRLPAKLPVLLMQGTEGIAVGMSTKVLPHNFVELLNAQIAIIRGEDFSLVPDFLQAGIMDPSEYQDGNGKVKVRALIEKSTESTKSVVIRQIPATTTTESIIHSIEEATRKNKIKVASIHDYTAENVEIEVTFQRGVNVDKAMIALYAYTDCEVSISPNFTIISENRPVILSVTEALKRNTEDLVNILKLELIIDLEKQENLFHAKTLEQIFIEQRIYKEIEEQDTFEKVIAAVDKGLKPFRDRLKRDVTQADIEKLLEIRIKRISRFDIEKSKRELEDIIELINEIINNLCNLRRFTINFIKEMLKKYGAQYPRLTTIDTFKQIDVKKVALKNVKVGYDRSSGMLGSGVKSDDSLACTEFDKLVTFSKKDGVCKVISIPNKLYIGKGNEVYKLDKNQVYSMIYRNKKSGAIYAKRFKVERFITDKEYNIIPKGCRIDKIYSTYGTIVRCEFEPAPRQQITSCDIVFSDITQRSLTASGFKVTDKKLAKYTLLERGSDEAIAVETTTDTTEVDETDDIEQFDVNEGKVPKYNKELNRVFSETRQTFKDRSFSGELVDLSDQYDEVTTDDTEKEISEIVDETIEEIIENNIDLPELEPETLTDQPDKTEKVESVKVEEEEVETPVENPDNSHEEPEENDSLSSMPRTGGYREISLEERQRRFKIDESTPFSLEID